MDPRLVDLTTTLAGMVLTSPVMVASGCGGNGRELARFGDVADLGALVTPSVTRDGGPGAPLPRVVETGSGLVHEGDLPGPGINGFLAGDLLWLLQHDVRTIVSIAGSTLGEYAELARRVGNTPGVAAIEVNLGHHYARDPVLAARAVAVVRRDTAAGVPVLAKLWPGGSTAPELVVAVSHAGADAIVLTGSQPGLVLDRPSLRPRLGASTGSLHGPAVLPVGLFAVWRARQALPDACLVGGGGIRTGADALDYLAAGADAVQVGSALLHDPTSAARIAGELRHALAARGLASPAAARDLAHDPSTPDGGA